MSISRHGCKHHEHCTLTQFPIESQHHEHQLGRRASVMSISQLRPGAMASREASIMHQLARRASIMSSGYTKGRHGEHQLRWLSLMSIMQRWQVSMLSLSGKHVVCRCECQASSSTAPAILNDDRPPLPPPEPCHREGRQKDAVSDFGPFGRCHVFIHLEV